MRKEYKNSVRLLPNYESTIYLPLQAQPILNGKNGEIKDIDAADVRDLKAVFSANNKSGLIPVKVRTLYNYAIVTLGKMCAGTAGTLIITGEYGQVCLRTKITIAVGKGGEIVKELTPYVFEVVGDCAFVETIKPHPLAFTNVGAIGVDLGMNVYNDSEDDGWHPNLQVSQNGIDWRDVTDEEWEMVAEGNFLFALMQGMTIYFRGMNPDGFNISTDDFSVNQFANFVWSHEETEIKVSGDIMSLVNYNERVEIPDNENACFTYLFGLYNEDSSPIAYADELIMPLKVMPLSFSNAFANCYNLKTAPTLPATTLANYCYSSMFNGCLSLVVAPSLPATALADYCYSSMFVNCISLVTAPALPATTLADYCYSSMFYDCTSLVTAPTLPAKTLADSCYESMFTNCTSLVTAPALPAKTLADYCYQNMFNNCTSLVTAPALSATTLANYCYSSMFYDCTSLVTAPALPATTLADSCYESMFYGCTSLVTAPALPATALADYCYSSMFVNCISLVTAPALPATTLADYCYSSMFYDCTSLVTAPTLPAKTLADSCYESMFTNCTSLVTAPALPATTLADYCYQNMFNNCTSLVTAPALSATTLANRCYESMFTNCTSLVTAPALPATTLADYCYSSMFRFCSNLRHIEMMAITIPTDATHSWVQGVAADGVFVKNAAATWESTGINGVPEGWRVEYKNV